MKAWRIAGFAINQQREEEMRTIGKVRTPKSRVQKEQRVFIERMFKGKIVQGNWLLNGLLARGGYLPTILPEDMPVAKLAEPKPLPKLDTPASEGLVKRTLKSIKKLAAKFGG